MRKCNERFFNSDIYARLRDARMSEADRQVAINALRTAELVADAIMWVSNKIESLAALFLKPILRH